MVKGVKYVKWARSWAQFSYGGEYRNEKLLCGLGGEKNLLD